MDQPSSAPSSPIEKLPTPTQIGGHSTALLVAVSVLIGLLIGILGFLAWQKTVAPIVPSVPTPLPVNNVSSTVPGTATSTSPTSPTTTATNVDPTDASLTVQWKTGTIVVPSAAFGSIIPENTFRVRSTSGYTGGIDEALPEYKFTYDYYEQGRVTDGPFKDHVVYGAKQLNREVDLGMDQTMSPEFFNLLVSPDKKDVRIIGMATSSVFGPAWPAIRFAPNLRLNVSSFPATLTLENGKVIRRAEVTDKATPSPLCGGSGCVDRLPIARTQDGRSLYQGPTGSFFSEQKVKPGCVILYRENGEGMVYESGIASAIRDPQVPMEANYVAARIITPAQLKWDRAFANTSTFRAHEIGGCGGIDCLRVLSSDELKESDLVQAGTTDLGDPIYVYKPESDGRPRAAGIVYETYEQWYEFDPQTNQKPPIGVFLQRVKVPVFFWKDALGRWVAYKNTIAVPLLECGKPVIYLYPTQTQDVHVKLPSFINVTVSDPTYPKEGWNVSAEPTGKLTLKDGTSVGSLFWEGLGVNYAVPKNGFVVKDGQVETFLNKTLPQYGLNAQEQKDFMEFWVPLMTGAPYYRISFLTDDWSKQVPLSVTPMPRTNIRLFMDWQRLAGPIELPEPTITTPTRNGFTLVEWGGLLR
jgi:hypothetical protein